MKAGKIHDIIQENWWYGRIVTLIVHFDPLPTDDYNETAATGGGYTPVINPNITPIK